MKVHGACHCRAVRFGVELYAPVPYLRCYCSICRKVAGSGGYAINLGAYAATLSIEHDGETHIGIYDPSTGEPGQAGGRGRRFCTRCASALWHFDPRWPELLHPFAACIDSELPRAPSHTHILLDSRASWVPVDTGPEDERCERYPSESLGQWHARRGLGEDPG